METAKEEVAIINSPLLKLLDETKLDKTKASAFVNDFTGFLEKAHEWGKKVDALEITDASQTKEMAQAREARLQLKELRVAADKTKKRLKENINIEGKFIDSVYRTIEDAIKPLEAKLLEKEKFVELKEKARVDSIIAERKGSLQIFIDSSISPANVNMTEIASMTDGQFKALVEHYNGLLEQKKERERNEAEKIQAENERLKREAELLEAELERQRVKAAEEEKIRFERMMAEKLEREEKERIEKERIGAEKKEHDRILAEQEEKAALREKELREIQRLEREAAEIETRRIKAENDERLRLEREEAERKRVIQEAKLKQEREEKERLEKELAEQQAAKEYAERERKAEERRAAMKPDKDKIFVLAEAIDAILAPEVASDEAKKIILNAKELLGKVSKYLRDNTTLL